MKKELGKLRRAELLELLLEQTKETERLEKELAGAKEQLRCREIRLNEAGSIAEAALQINDVFVAAQAAAEGGANAQRVAEASNSTAKEGFLTKEMHKQLLEVFEKFPNTVVIRAVIGQDTVSSELESFVNELVGIHEKVKTEIDDKTLQTGDAKPYLDICSEQGSVGIRYYSVPGGHEFNSFVVALYNASGAGKNSVSENTQQRIRALKQKHLLQVMATLSCTNCPEVVMATQKIATLGETVEAEMYDLSKFPEFKEKYSIMAVPCLVVDGGKEVLFGKKGVEEIVGILEKMKG